MNKKIITIPSLHPEEYVIDKMIAFSVNEFSLIYMWRKEMLSIGRYVVLCGEGLSIRKFQKKDISIIYEYDSI